MIFFISHKDLNPDTQSLNPAAKVTKQKEPVGATDAADADLEARLEALRRQ